MKDPEKEKLLDQIRKELEEDRDEHFFPTPDSDEVTIDETGALHY